MKKLFWTILVLFTFSISTAFSQSEENYLLSDDLLKAGKYKKALKLIDAAINENDQVAKYYALKGKILLFGNKDKEGYFAMIQKGIEVEPNTAMPILERAYYYDILQEYANCILDCNDALKIVKEDSVRIKILNEKGGIYIRTKKHEQAKEIFIEAFAIDSTNIETLNNMSISLDHTGETDRARDYLKRIAALEPDNFTPYINLGYHAAKHKKYEESLVYLNKADSLSPDQPYVLSNRGFTKLKLNDTEGALQDLKKSLKLDPTNSYAYKNMALVYIELNKNEIACENLYEAKRKGYTTYYGPEVEELIKTNCTK